jgi:hypothetical protein
MVLDSGEYNRQENGDAHSCGAERAEVAQLAQWSRKTDKEADNGGDGAPNDGASGRAIRESV